MYNFALRLNLTSHEKGRTARSQVTPSSNLHTDFPFDFRRLQPRLPVLLPIAFPGLDWDAHPSIQLLAGRAPGPLSRRLHDQTRIRSYFFFPGTTNMLVHDGKNEAKLFADLLASLRSTGKFSSSPAAAAAATSPPPPALVANTMSDVAAAEDALRVADVGVVAVVRISG